MPLPSTPRSAHVRKAWRSAEIWRVESVHKFHLRGKCWTCGIWKPKASEPRNQVGGKTQDSRRSGLLRAHLEPMHSLMNFAGFCCVLRWEFLKMDVGPVVDRYLKREPKGTARHFRGRSFIFGQASSGLNASRCCPPLSTAASRPGQVFAGGRTEPFEGKGLASRSA